MGKTIEEVKHALSLMNRMGVLSENTVKDRVNLLEGEGVINNPEELALAFENMKPEEGWKMSFGYITAAEKIAGNARFKGHGFSDAQKDSVKSFNDDDLNNYMGDESKFRGGNYDLYLRNSGEHKKGDVKRDTLYVKNPYRPNTNTCYLFSYVLVTANFTSSSGTKYKREKAIRDAQIQDIIRNNPDMVKAHFDANVGNAKFGEKYNEWMQENPNGTQNDFLIDKYTKGKPDKEFTRMGKVTPFYRNNKTNQIVLRSYYSKPSLSYSRNKYFVFNPETGTIKEISKEQAKAVSAMFVSQAEGNFVKEKTQLENSINAIKEGSTYEWKEYLANQIVTMKFSYYDQEDSPRHVEYMNKNAIVRYAKDKDGNDSYTPSGALSGFDSLYAEEEE